MIKECSDSQLIRLIKKVAPEQAQFISGPYFQHGQNFAFGWFENEKLVGGIRYCLQEIGVEQKTPPIMLKGITLTEAKINAFAVDESYRNRGIGKALQLAVIEDARKKGCSQVASYSTYDKIENYAVKLGLGFCVQPELQSNGMMGCYFLMKL